MPENKNIQQMSDEELIGLVRSNPDFFAHIVERYEGKILRYIRRISNSSQETAEDLGQEAFIKAYLKLNQFDQNLKFSAWLYRIAHNHVISYWRQHRKDVTVVENDLHNNFEKIFEPDKDLIGHLDNQLLNKKLGELMNQLKPIHREVMILRYMEDRDYQEIGDILRRPISSVGVTILRAKAELKKLLIKSKEFRR